LDLGLEDAFFTGWRKIASIKIQSGTLKRLATRNIESSSWRGPHYKSFVRYQADVEKSRLTRNQTVPSDIRVFITVLLS